MLVANAVPTFSQLLCDWPVLFFCFWTAAAPIRLPRSLKPRRNLRANSVLVRRPIINSQIASNRRLWNLGRMEGSPGLRRRLSASSPARIQTCWCGHGGCGWGGGGGGSPAEQLGPEAAQVFVSWRCEREALGRHVDQTAVPSSCSLTGVVQVCGLIFIRANNLYCLNSNFSPEEIKC